MSPTLWAPRAGRVELLAGDRSVPMTRDGHGWWHPEPAVEIEGDYWFVVDGDRLPDPRSPAQPAGLDGPSHPDEPGAFEWSDTRWRGSELRGSVIYEMHVGTFTDEGTFDSAIERLDHVRGLGATAVEVMPVNTFPGRWGWGYDGALLYAPQWSYGGPDAFRRFVDACHVRSLAVVLDVVYNHLGPSGNHLARFGPYFTDAHHTPWGDGINLDGPGSDEVRRFVLDNALRWVRDFHVDGLRLDAVHALTDHSAVHILEELAREVRQAAGREGRIAFVIGESDLNDPRLVAPEARGGYGLDAVWSDDFHHALHVALTGETDGYYADYHGWPDVARCLERVFVFDGVYSPSRDRRHGRPVGATPRSCFLGYSQTHDQVGNRATGERLSHLVDHRRAQMAAAIVLTSPFTPMLFQGEEWAASAPFQYFTDHPDPELAEAVREGRRREFGSFATFAGQEVPDPQDEATFRRSTLDWSELAESSHAEMLAWYRALLALRRAEPDLHSDGADDTKASYDAGSGTLRIRRGRTQVVCNVSDADTSVAVETGRLALANGAAVLDGETLHVPACSIAIVVPQDL